MGARKKVPKAIETSLLLAARRRCCLCVFLQDRDEVRRGQIAHLNRDPSDFRFDNLVWLCLEHHDEYDGRTSQSKGLTSTEVEAYREKLYARHPEIVEQARNSSSVAESQEIPSLPPRSDFEKLRLKFPDQLWCLKGDWRYPLWQVANEPDLFAYKAGNGADGISLIERIDIPDGRIVVACISVAGNPGNSITNSAEFICFQVCERFEIPPERLVWLEHYDEEIDSEWSLVTFGKGPPDFPFGEPRWTTMTPELWENLKLRPKKKLVQRYGRYESKLLKTFAWPTEAIS
jgi:hypothetical protein